MDIKQLENIQAQWFFEHNQKVDVHHSEIHRGILIVPAGQMPNPFNILQILRY